MRTVSLLLLLAFAMVACSKPAETVKKAPAAAPVAAGPDKQYTAFNPADPNVQQLGDGLMVLDLEVGSGKLVEGVALAKLNYTGWLPSTGKVFDANWKHSAEPVEFPLAKGQLIDGFLNGFKGMREGGRRKIFIPAALGYGANGQGDIPANSDLLFEVTLFELKEAPEQMKKAAAEAEAAALKAKEAPVGDQAKPVDTAPPVDQGK